MFRLTEELKSIDKALYNQKMEAQYYVYHEGYERDWKRYLLRRSRQRARKKNLEFNLTEKDITLTTTCPVLGISIAIKHPNRDQRLSLDRINNTMGYVRGNVHVISNRANRLKNDGTSEELMKIAMYFKALDKADD